MLIKDTYNPKLEQAISKHVFSYRKGYFKFWEKMYNHLKANNNYASFGDADFHYTLIHEQTDKDGNLKRVFTVKNSCTCSDQANWIVIYEAKCPLPLGKFYTEKLHVRIIYPESTEYPNKQYPDKLNLKFWEDRNYQCEYVGKYHMTNLGGVYGDIRDKGYVISYKKDSNSEIDKFNSAEQVQKYLNEWNSFTSMLHSTECELNELD